MNIAFVLIMERKCLSIFKNDYTRFMQLITLKNLAQFHKLIGHLLGTKHKICKVQEFKDKWDLSSKKVSS